MRKHVIVIIAETEREASQYLHEHFGDANGIKISLFNKIETNQKIIYSCCRQFIYTRLCGLHVDEVINLTNLDVYHDRWSKNVWVRDI